MRLKFS